VLVVLTANHRNARFDLLEKLSVGAPQAASSLVEGSDAVAGAVVLATCNRFEAYLDVSEPIAHEIAAVDRVVKVVSDASGVDATELRETVTVLTGDAVAEHLFAVSSGLESVVVGEDEIAGQVKRSLQTARESGTTSSDLERLFQGASRASRGVKTRTALGGAGRSLVRLGLELASSRVRDWSATSVLLVGTGQYAATTVAALRDRGVEQIAVFSPSGRAARFALKQGVTAVTSLPGAIAAADVVITCTSTQHPVVTPATIPGGARALVIDLGLPRNVDPAVSSLAGIELLDLETIRLHAPLPELRAATEAREIVGSAAAEFVAAGADAAVSGAITSLRQHMMDVLDAEIARARDRGDSSEQTERALRHLVSVLLHTPSVRARELARDGEADRVNDAINALYGLSPVTRHEVARTDDAAAG
jgi:glutamyl-tRNA reductase